MCLGPFAYGHATATRIFRARPTGRHCTSATFARPEEGQGERCHRDKTQESADEPEVTGDGAADTTTRG